MNDLGETILTVVGVIAACVLSGAVLFAVGSMFVAFGFLWLRLAGLVA